MQLNKNGKIKEKKTEYKRVILRKNGVYEDKIENIVYNEKALKAFLKNKKNHLKKKIKDINCLIKSLKNKDILNNMREYVNSIFFNSSYNEVFEKNESALKRMKKEYEEIKDLTEENYFDGLTHEKKKKL